MRLQLQRARHVELLRATAHQYAVKSWLTWNIVGERNLDETYALRGVAVERFGDHDRGDVMAQGYGDSSARHSTRVA